MTKQIAWPATVASPTSPLTLLENFRRSRIESLCTNPPSELQGIEETPLFVCHVLPVAELSGSLVLAHHTPTLLEAIRPPGTYGHDGRHNADGFLTFSRDNEVARSYVQWLRFGGLEIAANHLVHKPSRGLGGHGFPTLDSTAVLRTLLLDLPKAVLTLRSTLGVEPPLAASVTLLGMRDVRLSSPNGFPSVVPIGRDVVVTPWITLPDSEAEVRASMRDVADVIWQSVGQVKAPATVEQLR